VIRRRRLLTGYPYRLARLAEPLPRAHLPTCRGKGVEFRQAGTLTLQRRDEFLPRPGIHGQDGACPPEMSAYQRPQI